MRKAYLSVHKSDSDLWYWMAIGDGFGVKQAGFPSKQAAINAANSQHFKSDVEKIWS